jgi:putative ABC transport system permease protein
MSHLPSLFERVRDRLRDRRRRRVMFRHARAATRDEHLSRTTWADDLARDVRHAARQLRHQPLFALIAAASIAIGIGANTTIFTIAHALLFRPPAGVADSARLVDIGRSRGPGSFSPNSYPNYLDIRRRATTLDGVYAFPLFPEKLSFASRSGDRGGVERIYGAFVTTDYFTVLGAVPTAGRLFTAADGDEGRAAPIVVVSYDFWTRRFNRDPNLVGRALTINQRAFTVLGVAAAGFHGTGVRGGDVWIPIGALPTAIPDGTGMLTNRAAAWLLIGGRLKPGVTEQRAAAEMDVIGKALAAEYPEQNRDTGLSLVGLSPIAGNVGTVGMFLALLLGLVTLVVVIACANLSGVLLARAVARRREIAVRLAIGAGRARLVRQLLAETLVLFALGGAAGLAVARVMTSLLVSFMPSLPFPVDVSLALDVRAVVFTAGLALVTAVLCGVAPALQASRTDVVAAMKDDDPVMDRLRLRHVFLVAQVALSVLLVVVAGLFGRALQRIGASDPGFDPHGVELATLDLTLGGYNDTTGPAFAREVLQRVRALPGVQTSTIAAVLPGGFERIGLGGLGAPGVTVGGERFSSADWNIVEPGYFATIRMPLVAGRDFNEQDRKKTLLVTIIGEGVAKRFFGGANPIGKQIIVHRDKADRLLTVVGVARDPKYGSLVDGNSGLYVYLPLQQEFLPGWSMLIVTRMNPGQDVSEDIRGLLANMDRNMPMITTQSAGDYTALGLLPQRIAVAVAGSLGVVGLLLAAIGIYGVTAYVVARRTREIGVRVALGAGRTHVVLMILREGMMLTAMGLAIGVVLAGGFAQLLTSLLFGTSPFDPVTVGIVAILFLSISAAACFVPAWRATHITALEALRTE